MANVAKSGIIPRISALRIILFCSCFWGVSVAKQGLAFAKIKQQRDLLPFELPGALGTIEGAEHNGKIEREKR